MSNSPEGALQVLLSVHVDDLKATGLQKEIELVLETREDGSRVLSQDHYVSVLLDANDKADAETASAYRSLLGGVVGGSDASRYSSIRVGLAATSAGTGKAA